MTLPIYRLRRLLMTTAIVLTVAVAGMYFYARSRTLNVLKTIPGKIGLDIKQTANGFQFSKSEGGRTQFTVQAHDVKQFKINGNAELHGVNILLYGRDSTRFDQISGDDFAFDQKTGDVTAKGEVQIDLVANPAGGTSPDQAAPKELKNPIHLKTRDLVFNKQTGDAMTDARVDFSTPQATGWAVGVKYDGKTRLMTLTSQVHLTISGDRPAQLEAEHGVITSDPRQIELERPRLERTDGMMTADHATFFLTSDDHVERIVATGNVTTESRPATGAGRNQEQSDNGTVKGRADEAEFLLVANQNVVRTAALTGHVQFEQSGPQPMEGSAGRAVLDFAGKNELQKVHALEGARLHQLTASTGPAAQAKGGTQDFELKAPEIDFDVAGGRLIRHAETAGPPIMTIIQTQTAEHGTGSRETAGNQKTVVTAGKFTAEFAQAGGKNRLSAAHGFPNAKIVNSVQGEPDRVSTSDMVDASFLAQGGIDAVTQTGNVVYTDNQPGQKRVQAWSRQARYTPADEMLVMTGNPRVVNGGMETTANMMRINRATDDAFAEGNVKSTYSELKEQPDGALLASASPIHVTSGSMTAHNSPSVALYTGSVRLWQDANVIQAPSIEFDRDRRFVTAQGTAAQPVQTVLIQTEKTQTESTGQKEVPTSRAQNAREMGHPGQKTGSSPVAITSFKLTYADEQRKAHYEGGVVAKGADFTATSNSADAYMLPRSEMVKSPGQNGPGQLDKIVAIGSVVVQQPKRRAEGNQLVYTAADDKFVLTGGASNELPSIFDAEQGKITGVSLTFFRRDDRVLVEGEASNSVVRTTRVAP